MIDLHCHSTASDGSFSPTELIRMAEEKGITHLALTDHDTTDGVREFLQVKTDIACIPGIEISVNYNNSELHMVGLFIDIDNKDLVQLEKEVKEYRKERNNNMIISLSKLVKKPVSISDLLDNPKSQLGRPHVAKYLVKNNIVGSYNEAFDLYLKDGAPLAVEKQRVSVERAINVIKSAGGLAIVAHPSTLNLSDQELEELLIKYKHLGLDGMEVYSSHSPSEKKTVFEAAAHKLGLVISCGSDFHGINGKVSSLGADIGCLSDEDILKPMYKRLES